MRINLTEYRPASTSVLGPIGGSTVAPAETATGQTLNDIKNQRDQQIMDMITGGLDATALVLEANKKIKAGEDEIRLLNAEEKAKSKSSNVYESAFKNESISVGSNADEYTYSVDPSLGTYRHQDWNQAEANIRESITQEVIDELRKEGGEIDEKLELKLRKKIDIAIDKDLYKTGSIVLERSSKAVDLAIQKKADNLYYEVAKDPSTFNEKRAEFREHIQAQVDNNMIDPVQATGWIKKIDEDFSLGIMSSYLDSEDPVMLKTFKDEKKKKFTKEEKKQGYKSLWESLAPEQQLKLNARLFKIEGKISNVEMENLGLLYIDDPDANFGGAGGSQLINHLIGSENWSFDAETGKVDIKSTELKEDSLFAGTKPATVARLLNSAVSRLESDWKSKNVLSSEDTRVLTQNLQDWGKNITEGVATGWGGTADGYNFKPNNIKMPENFLKGEIFTKSKVDQKYPNLTDGVANLQNLISDHVTFANKVVNWDVSRKDYTAHMKNLKKEILSIKNQNVKAIGLNYYAKVSRQFSYRNNVLNNMNDGNKDNFHNLYWHDWARKNTNGNIPGIGNQKDKDLRIKLERRSQRAQLIWLGVPKSEWGKEKFYLDEKLMNLLQDNFLPHGVDI